MTVKFRFSKLLKSKFELTQSEDTMGLKRFDVVQIRGSISFVSVVLKHVVGLLYWDNF